MHERRIEEASLNSWPADQQLLFDGCLLRFAEGYTKRANSVTPLYPGYQPVEEKIATCERLYAARQMPAIFRLPSFLETASEYDTLLEQRGYEHRDLTQVMQKDVASTATASLFAPIPENVPLATWLPIFCRLHQSDLAAHQHHRAILERIATPPLFAVLYQDGEPVACALGVPDNDTFGIFDVVTDPRQRRKGYASALINGMLAQARAGGARAAYLQVVQANQGALRLYERLGFQECYRYWYRVQPHS